MTAVLLSSCQKKQLLRIRAFICIVLLCIAVMSCRTQFSFLQGTEEEIKLTEGHLSIQANKTQVYTRGNPDSMVVLRAHCSLPGTQTIRWDLGDGTVKNGSDITHDYAYARTYTIQASCSNEQRALAQESLVIQVDYRNPLVAPATSPGVPASPSQPPATSPDSNKPRCEPYWDNTRSKMAIRCTK